jgi:glyoxylase-like metal-dependent hydrolase (beta-lactamase superfamily II)
MARLYFRQWLSGQDYGAGVPGAAGMRNFAYAIGDADSGEAVLVDPAYDVDDLVDLLEADGMRCVGALATHYHVDHVGGEFQGYAVKGIASLLERVDVPIHVQRLEAPWVERSTGVSDALSSHDGGDVVLVGGIPVTLLHTPGHTPGSQCLLVDGMLLTGDTLFIDGCGRTDLPGGDVTEMHETLTRRLSRIADSTEIYPGHFYSEEPSMPMAALRIRNDFLGPKAPDADPDAGGEGTDLAG